LIEAYSFGFIKIDGREFRKDLIILPDGSVHHPWWRRSGHRLTLADLEPVLAASPDSMVVGSGAYGRMKAAPGLEEELAGRGIEVEMLPTEQAVERFNTLVSSGAMAVACLHLTC
jgi:hypothetical protein